LIGRICRCGSIGSGAAALAGSPIVANIVWFYLKAKRIGNDGTLFLAESKHLEQVRELPFSEKSISEEGVGPLRERFGSRVWIC
jgi:hypothetical protein